MRDERSMIEGEYKPISAWGYLGYELLFAIPAIGLICALVLSLVAPNKNVKNFARSQFCFVLIVLILYGIAVALGVDITP